MARTSTKPYDGPVLHGQTFDFAQADDVLSKLVPGDSIRFDGIPDPDAFRAKLNEWRLKRKAEFDGTLCFMCSGNEVTFWADDERTMARIRAVVDAQRRDALGKARLLAKAIKADPERERRDKGDASLRKMLRDLKPGETLHVPVGRYPNITAVRVAASEVGKETGGDYTVTAQITVRRVE